MQVDANGDGLSSGFNGFAHIMPECGIVRLKEFHRFAGVSERTVKLWVQDGLPVMRHRMKEHSVRIARWIEFMERYDNGLPPKEPPKSRNRKKKDQP